MDLIIDSDSGFASSTNILNLADQLQTKKMKKKEIEQLLQQFVQDKWLIEVCWLARNICYSRTVGFLTFPLEKKLSQKLLK